jgi:N-succinyldiaminopimelate aminotransferase
MPSMAQRVAEFGTTIFSEINVLARQHNAVNLGQGAPDFDSPPEVIAEAVKALRTRRGSTGSKSTRRLKC